MPAGIAAFIRDALAEEKYGEEFNSKIDDRVQEMNAAQLQGIYKHLESEARKSRSDIWRNANNKIISHVEGLMFERVGEIEKIKKAEEDEEMKELTKDKLKVIRAAENASALEAVDRNARTQSENEIREAEIDRKRKERTELVMKTAYAQERRDVIWNRLGIFYGTSNLLIIIGFSLEAIASATGGLGGAIIGGYIGLSSLVCGYWAYHQWKSAIFVPLVVTEEELEEQIDEREDEIRENMILDMEEKKRLFKLQVKKEKIDRRARREEERLKKEYEEQQTQKRLRDQAEALADIEREKNEASSLATGTLKSNSRGGSRVSTPAKSLAGALDLDGIKDDDNDDASLSSLEEGSMVEDAASISSMDASIKSGRILPVLAAGGAFIDSATFPPKVVPDENL